MLHHVVLQIVADQIGVPPVAGQQALRLVGSGVARPLGQLPSRSCVSPDSAIPADSPAPGAGAPASGTSRQCTHALARCPQPIGPSPPPHPHALPQPHLINTKLPQFYPLLICGCSISGCSISGCVTKLESGWFESIEHQMDHCYMNPGLAGFRQLFVVFAESSAPAQPGQCALHYPPAGQYLEVVAVGTAAHHLQQPAPVTQAHAISLSA